MNKQKEVPCDSENVSLRDQFAMAAMTGILHNLEQGSDMSNELIAMYSYKLADAMMEARK